MKTITKSAECPALREWKRENSNSPQNIHYNYLGAPQRGPMLDAMVREQGGICAYTMQSIRCVDTVWQAHIEHIFPRSLHPAQSVDWGNMVACIPKPNEHADYGAKLKDAYDPATSPFVNPTRNVASHFRFHENGELQGLTSEGEATVSPQVLHLNHPHLLNDRKGKIKGALDRKPSAVQARQRAQQLRERDTRGMFEPYCEALAQVLEAYATRLENKAQRMAGVRRP
ncbi:hypothetical protein [Giesbergeria anulus]|uniref:TIGR02646 family protein n=1 Tax=Giesbergeria anulus TaxID=180197 RepID=A0A1H9NP63_9BURK|nr:hypothetical protein [Giesbergeria anulus]SER37804.1 TIGR02646 family protein [Giesbergeria anulus]